MPGPIKPLRFAEILYRADNRAPRPDQSYAPQIQDTVHFSKEALEKLEKLLAGQKPVFPEKGREQDEDPQGSLAILQLGPDATIDQVKRAYLELVKKYHPDNYANLPPEFQKVAEEKTKQINEAYSTLRRIWPAC